MPKIKTKKFKNGESVRVSFYIPGELPSAAELTSYFSLFHGVLTWSGIAQISYPSSISGDEPEPLSWRIRDSYRRFLYTKYEEQLFDPMWFILGFESGRWRSDDKSRTKPPEWWAEGLMARYIRSRDLPDFKNNSGETNVDLTDFFEWSVEYFGSHSLPVDSIDTSGSIEILFELAPFMAIIGLQDYPTTRAVVLHAVTVIKALIGKRKPSTLPPVMKLSKSVRDVIVQYDDVELRTDADGSWSIRLCKGLATPADRGSVRSRKERRD